MNCVEVYCKKKNIKKNKKYSLTSFTDLPHWTQNLQVAFPGGLSDCFDFKILAFGITNSKTVMLPYR